MAPPPLTNPLREKDKARSDHGHPAQPTEKPETAVDPEIGGEGGSAGSQAHEQRGEEEEVPAAQGRVSGSGEDEAAKEASQEEGGGGEARQQGAPTL